jgi:hypothetical protein
VPTKQYVLLPLLIAVQFTQNKKIQINCFASLTMLTAKVVTKQHALLPVGNAEVIQ